MATVTVSLSDDLKAFVDSEVDGKRYTSAADYVHWLVMKAHLEKHQDRLEQLLLEGLNSPMSPLTAQDWEDIRREIRERLARDKKKRKRKRA